jgi:hypothetical protein
VTSLPLKRASASRPSGEWNDDDYDVLCDGVVVGRIMKVAAVGTPWLLTLAWPRPARRSHADARLAVQPTRCRSQKSRHEVLCFPDRQIILSRSRSMCRQGDLATAGGTFWPLCAALREQERRP